MSLRGILRVIQGDRVGFFCPGCEEMHVITIPPHLNAWGFDGNYDAPTFTPSVLVRGFKPITDDEHVRIMSGEKLQPTPRVCHSFVRNGTIEFLSDSTHALAGKSVKLQAPWGLTPKGDK